jgi:hypothetical protein
MGVVPVPPRFDLALTETAEPQPEQQICTGNAREAGGWIAPLPLEVNLRRNIETGLEIPASRLQGVWDRVPASPALRFVRGQDTGITEKSPGSGNKSTGTDQTISDPAARKAPDRTLFASPGLQLVSSSTVPEPRSLHESVDAAALSKDELEFETTLIQQWLEAHPQRDQQTDHLRSELQRFQVTLQLKSMPFQLRFYNAWNQAREASLKQIHQWDREAGGSIGRGLIDVKDLVPRAEDVWKSGIAGGLFTEGDKQQVYKWSGEMASQTFDKRYAAAKYGHVYGQERYYEQSGTRPDDDKEIWSRGRAFGLFLPGEKATVLRISAAGQAMASYLTQRINLVDPASPEAAKLIDAIHDFTGNPAVVLLGPEVAKLLGPFGYTYYDSADAAQAAHDINTAYQKYLPAHQIRASASSTEVRWDECMRRQDLGVNNIEAAKFDPDCLSLDEFNQERNRRANEFKQRFEDCGHSRPSHFECRDRVAAEYFPAEQARQDAYRTWVRGELDIYQNVVDGGVVSQTGFHFAHDVLGWPSDRSAAFAGALSTVTNLAGAYVQRRATLQTPPPEAPPAPAPITEVVEKQEPMPQPDRPAGQVVAKVTAKPAFEVKPLALPPADLKPMVQQLTAEIVHAEQRVKRLEDQAAHAETNYARSLRNTARAKERRGQPLTQQETDLLAAKESLAKLRDDARAKRDQLRESLDALQRDQATPRFGQAGLAEEPKYRDELRARGLRAELVDTGTPVIDVAILGTREVHSVKTLEPSRGLEAAVRSAEAGSHRDLADRVSARITEALMDRGSDKWSRLRNQWNTTKRGTYADRYGYELPKNPDEINFVVDVRVVSANAPPSQTQKAVEAAVTAWLTKNQRVPPQFTWQITYVSK